MRLATRWRGRGRLDREPAKLPTTPLERVAIVLASLALSFGLIAVLSKFFAGRDKAGVSGTSTGIGQQYKDLGHRHLRPGQPRPPYNSNPPTSGAHIPEPVLINESELNVDQLLEALEAGDVVIMYGGRQPPRGLHPVTRSLAYRFTPALAAAGQALILARRPGTRGLIVLAWTRMLRVATPANPLLRQFVQQQLGRGAP